MALQAIQVDLYQQARHQVDLWAYRQNCRNGEGLRLEGLKAQNLAKRNPTEFTADEITELPPNEVDAAFHLVEKALSRVHPRVGPFVGKYLLERHTNQREPKELDSLMWLSRMKQIVDTDQTPREAMEKVYEWLHQNQP